MKKTMALLKACMTDNMSIFKLKANYKKNNNQLKFTLILTCLFLAIMWFYASTIIEPLAQFNAEILLLSLFVVFTSILTLVEGIYKSSSLLFKCRDDDLLLSMPLKKSTILFVRIFKFYIFEVLYNSLFLVPSMLVYARYVDVQATYYLVSIIALFVLPIIPIVISCILGGITTAYSSRFRMKNIVQVIVTVIVLLGVMYLSFNLENILNEVAQNASSINEAITRIYYPAGAYVNLVENFNIQDLLTFIFINLALYALVIMILSKVYFRINSRMKTVKNSRKKQKYKIKINSPMKALIKKELKRFASTPVFITNAGFGLVLFIVGCITIVWKIDGVKDFISSQMPSFDVQQLEQFIPVILFGFIGFTSFMTSITSSMLSLEGKAFTILKSMPLKPFKIVISKVFTALVVMIPCILIGDLIMFVKFEFSFMQILMILIASIIFPLLSETIGIIINLRYPRLDGQNDTQVVKQSMSSMVATFLGITLSTIMVFWEYKCVVNGMTMDTVMLNGLGICSIVDIVLLLYLKLKSKEKINSLNV